MATPDELSELSKVIENFDFGADMGLARARMVLFSSLQGEVTPVQPISEDERKGLEEWLKHYQRTLVGSRSWLALLEDRQTLADKGWLGPLNAREQAGLDSLRRQRHLNTAVHQAAAAAWPVLWERKLTLGEANSTCLAIPGAYAERYAEGPYEGCASERLLRNGPNIEWGTVHEMVMHLNDDHNASREEIADWLESIGL